MLVNKYKACKTDNSLSSHYLEVYDYHFSKLRLLPLEICEIGVQRGGSLKMWADYFPNAQITGIDIKKKCKKHESQRIKIIIGDQADKKFLVKLGNFDIIIDDGGHTMTQQKTSLKYLWDHLNKGGIYVIEDLETSYWPRFGGGYGREKTTIQKLKSYIDSLNCMAIDHSRAEKYKQKIKNLNIKSMHFYPSMCFLYKR